MTRFAPAIPALALAATLAACGPPAPPQAAAGTETPDGAPDAGYVAPPEIVSGVRRPQGLALSGTAPAGAEVQLVAPDGKGGMATADDKGAWSLIVPAPMAAPAMYALSARIGERVVRAEGAVLAVPAPGPPVVLARAGFAALPLEGPLPRLQVTALDYDAGGGAAVAGVGPARARVRLSIDGVEAGLDQSDARGRFAVIGANRPLEPGARRLRVEADGGAQALTADVLAQVSPVAPLNGSAFRAVRQDGGWRVDWARAGGGVQSTFVFDVPPEPAP
ncbi:MAG: hypothetical protein B7Y99_08445 [Caulobacterales bacterium 32-69-10]|nr:MAG: hypothetical protein B7Y99_08445 [Caulobacterales bacterium 32-69-10]